jgi:hypothetical protein
MKRRTLDIMFAGGGIVVAVLLAVLALVVGGQAAFADNYVATELGAQKITFATADKLTDAEKTWQPGSTCLVTYAGQNMTTGPQAECYAKYYIREHMHASAESAGFPGATYATLGSIRTDLSTQIAAAKTAGDTTKAADLQKKLDSATSLRSTLQSGETLSGLLLTVYGFSVIASIAAIATNVLYALAALMALLSIAGFVHAFVTPKDKVVFGPIGSRVPSGA